MEAQSNTQVRSFSLGLTPVDKFFLAYNVLVLALVGVFGSERPDFTSLIVWHVTLTGLTFLLAIYEMRQGGRIAAFLRFAYPAVLLPFVHYESGLLSPLVTDGYFDAWFVSIDRFLFGRDLYAWLAPNVGGLVMNEIMNAAYFAFYLLILGTLLGTYFWRRHWTGELIFVLTLCLYAHYFFFIVFPVVGPTDLRPALFAAQEGWITPFVYNVVASGDTAGGAFPSSHCAGAVLLNCYAGRIFGKKIGWLLAPLSVLIVLSSIYLSMHYVIDSIAGIIVGAFFFWYGPRVYRMLRKEET